MNILEKRQHTPISDCIKMVTKFEVSDLTGKEFCEQEGLSSKTFYRWRKRVEVHKAKKASGQSKLTARFAKGEAVAIKAELAKPKQSLEVILASGTRLKFPDVSHEQVIVRLIRQYETCS